VRFANEARLFDYRRPYITSPKVSDINDWL